MGRGRKKKLIIIIILTVAITSLSIGLATFSNVLTISSSATVKPNDGEYKVTIYGWAVDPSTIAEFSSIEDLFSNYATTTYSIPVVSGTGVIASPATIDNNMYKIQNITVTFVPYSSPSEIETTGAVYNFLMQNEGAHNIYIDSTKILELNSTARPHTCIAVDQTKQSVVDEHCNRVGEGVEVGRLSFSSTSGLDFTPLTNDDMDSEQGFILEPGQNIAFAVYVMHGLDINTAAETGEFSIQFEDISLDFGSLSPTSE